MTTSTAAAASLINIATFTPYMQDRVLELIQTGALTAVQGDEITFISLIELDAYLPYGSEFHDHLDL
jgi:DNA-binding IclR family transcriptional regulator